VSWLAADVCVESRIRCGERSLGHDDAIVGL
jgi:hypothetical protein